MKKFGLLFVLAAAFVLMQKPQQASAAEADLSQEEITCQKESNTVSDVIQKTDDLAILSQLIQNAGLTEALKEKGPYTLFAPTDAAFAKLPKETIAELLKPENKEKLIDILTYHVVPQKILAKDVLKADGKEIPMLNQKKIKIGIKDGKVYVNDSLVTKTDIKAKNGVIHLIDSVLLPK